jgi:hypothetical protein
MASLASAMASFPVQPRRSKNFTKFSKATLLRLH